MARTGVMTGFAEIDAKLKNLEPKLVNKFARQSLRKNGKIHRDETRDIIEQETDGEGALAASYEVKAMKRSRTRIGVSVTPSRAKYFTEYEKRYGELASPAAGESEPFYVPAAIEFGVVRGESFTPPVRAQRRSLYDNQEQYRNNFKQDMREIVQEAGK